MLQLEYSPFLLFFVLHRRCSVFLLPFQVVIPCSWIFGLVINFPGFIVKNFDPKATFCIRRYSEDWMGKTYTLIWSLLLAFLPALIMAALYVRVVHLLWFHRAEHPAFDHRQQVR